MEKEKVRKLLKAYGLKMQINENLYDASTGELFDEIYEGLVKLFAIPDVIQRSKQAKNYKDCKLKCRYREIYHTSMLRRG